MKSACLQFVGAVLTVSLLASCGGDRRKAIDVRETASVRLGKALREQGVDSNPVVMANPFTREKGHPADIYDFQDAALDGFKRSGLGRVEVVYPALQDGAAEDPFSVRMPAGITTPLSYLIQPDAFDRAIAEHPDASVVISLIGLPASPAACEFWRDENAPPLALLLPELRMIGGRDAIVDAFRSGRIAAAVVPLPREAAPAADADAFDQRYLLLTAESVEAVLSKYPRLSRRR